LYIKEESDEIKYFKSWTVYNSLRDIPTDGWTSIGDGPWTFKKYKCICGC
jgi:hypothetical protein